MRNVPHERALELIEVRGYNTQLVTEEISQDIENIRLDSDTQTYKVLDWVEVEKQVYDGVWDGPGNGPEFDFSHFLAENEPLVGRMMYYMVSWEGEKYTYEDLVSDLEKLAEKMYVDATFTREKVPKPPEKAGVESPQIKLDSYF